MEHAKIETDSIVNPSSAVGCIQIVPKYISEAKMNRGQSPNILSEIFDLNENEGRGGTLAGIETRNSKLPTKRNFRRILKGTVVTRN